MLILLIALVAQPHFAACGCQCVDGVPKTLCQTIVEAQQQPYMCSAQVKCPALKFPADDQPAHDRQEQEYLDAPDEHAHSCREVRIWDQQRNVYTGVKVCDVFTG